MGGRVDVTAGARILVFGEGGGAATRLERRAGAGAFSPRQVAGSLSLCLCLFRRTNLVIPGLFLLQSLTDIISQSVFVD